MSYIILGATAIAVIAIWLVLARFRFQTATIEKGRRDATEKRRLFREQAEGGESKPRPQLRKAKRGFGARG